MKSIFIYVLSFFASISEGQINAFVKGGINFGTINKDYWFSPDIADTVYYNKALIRPILGIGASIQMNNWILRQELMYQVKGQGTKRPDFRSLFQTSHPDILRFMSFPFSVHRKIISKIYLGVAMVPSFYISGSDNYTAKDRWRGWTWGSIISLKYLLNSKTELGIEYDHDFVRYYCRDCDEKFITYRVYGMYHFTD